MPRGRQTALVSDERDGMEVLECPGTTIYEYGQFRPRDRYFRVHAQEILTMHLGSGRLGP